MSVESLPAVAVYCGSSIGTQPAFKNAARSLGAALAKNQRPLVYGGGSKGIMGIVSGSVLEGKGKVTGIIPYAMVAAGGEGSRSADAKNPLDTKGDKVLLDEVGREEAETIVVESMHERKVEMAKRVGGFIGLPGGFGTFEEMFEVITWTQLGIHDKPVVFLNVRGFYEPIKQMVDSAVEAGFISPGGKDLTVFVDGPQNIEEHDTFDWGSAALNALDAWRAGRQPKAPLFDWTKRRDGSKGEDNFSSS